MDQSQETHNALTKREFEDLHEEINTLRAQVQSLQADREKAMRWGILTLGSAVVFLGGWIVKLLFNKVGM